MSPHVSRRKPPLRLGKLRANHVLKKSLVRLFRCHSGHSWQRERRRDVRPIGPPSGDEFRRHEDEVEQPPSDENGSRRAPRSRPGRWLFLGLGEHRPRWRKLPRCPRRHRATIGARLRDVERHRRQGPLRDRLRARHRLRDRSSSLGRALKPDARPHVRISCDCQTGSPGPSDPSTDPRPAPPDPGRPPSPARRPAARRRA